MTEQFYQRYPIDEMTPVQFVGVYAMHWRPEWGEPEVMFAEVDAPLYNAALQLLEALEGTAERLERALQCDDGWAQSEDWQAVEDARAAIAAAKGEK